MAEEQFTDSGKLLKMEVDYSATVDEKLPQCKQMGRVSYVTSIDGQFLTTLFFRKESCKKHWIS